MTSLSWMIYFIGVVDTLNSFGLWLVIPSTLVLLGCIIMYMVFSGMEAEYSINKESTPVPDVAKISLKRVRRAALAAWIIGWFIVIIVPNRSTLIMIAGAELTSIVIQSKEVKDIVNPGVDLLKTWIKDETDRLSERRRK